MQKMHEGTDALKGSISRLEGLAAVVQFPKQGAIITGTTSAEVLKAAREVLTKGGVDILLIKPCASKDFELTRAVPRRAAAIRIAQQLELTNDKTL